MRGLLRFYIGLRLRQRLADAGNSLPLTVPAALATFGIVATALLVLGTYYTWLVLSLGIPAALAAAFFAHRLTHRTRPPGSRREQTLCSLIAAGGVLLWLAVNIPFASQHIFTDRDPATYAVAGAWLVNHDNLRIPAAPAYTAIPGVSAASLGFSPSTHDPHEIYAQGAHILPALLGLAGRLAGLEVMLAANLVFGSVALLALYGFARLVMRPRWALAATATFAASLPLLYFSRDTYTEPLAMAFIFGSLACLWYGRKTGSYSAWLLAGLMIGAGLLARIDTYLPLAALALALVIDLCMAPAGRRLALLRRVGVMAAATAAIGLLAWLDLSLLSSGYYRDLRPQYIAEILLLGTVTVSGAAAVAVAWRSGWLHRLEAATRSWRPTAGVFILTMFFTFLASRSLWQTNYAMKGEVAVRSYAEHTLLWMTWYLGPAVAVLGIIATIWLWRRLLRGQTLELLPFMLVMAACTMYLINPNISSDQIWASRRFLPVILPGLTILCYMLLDRSSGWPVWKLRRFGGFDTHPSVVASSLATLAVIGPLFVSLPFIFARTYAPQLSQIRFVCNSLPENAVVAWIGEAKQYAIQPTQAFCGVPAVGVEKDDKLASVLEKLSATAQQQGQRLVLGAQNADTPAIPVQYKAALVRHNTIVYSDVEQTYKKFPRNQTSFTQALSLGEWLPEPELASAGKGTDAN